MPPTRDIDFTPRVTQENLGRLSTALTDLGAQIRTEGVPEGLPFRYRILRRPPPSPPKAVSLCEAATRPVDRRYLPGQP